MNYFTNLVIADLSLQFCFGKKTDRLFFESKYRQYISFDKRSKPVVTIIVDTGKKRGIREENNNYYLSLPSIRKQFQVFNYLLRLIFFSIINRNGGLVLHGSSLIKGHHAYIFVGPEGSGKSTIRRLFPEFISLGDDSAIVRKSGNRYYLYGSPFYQKTKLCYPNISVSLNSIIRIIKGSNNQIKLLTYPNDYKEIFTNAYGSIIGNTEEERILLLRTVDDFCQNNKVWVLSFKKDRSVFRFIEKTLP